MDRAPLYVLGQLNKTEHAEFEAHMRECPLCDFEVQALTEAASMLALEAPPSAPPSPLRERVLAAATALPPAVHIVRAGHGEWQDVGNGVHVKRLFFDPVQNMATMLVRMEPGASYAAHRHAAHEQCLVLEGGIRFGELEFGVGDYQCAFEGSSHEAALSPQGCLLLIVASRHDEIVS
jgi:anti-sigma factor ChrR (cupin superfamily)